jgi:polygalacturonase
MAEYNIASFEGLGDGLRDNSKAFEEALRAVAEAGGGTLRVGQGIWRTGPLELFSGTTLTLDDGAVISFIPEPERYRPVWTRWEGVDCYAMRPCLFAAGRERIQVAGKGALDGGGPVWWNLLREKRRRGQAAPETQEERELARLNPEYRRQAGGGGGRDIQFLRPPLVQFLGCFGVNIRGVELRNSPFWTLHPVYCAGLRIEDLTIINPPDAPNTDGIDIDSCEDVVIQNCRVSVGDDGIALKSGSGGDGIRAARPCRGVKIRGCTVENGHGGIVIGSETAAGIYDILVEDCLFKGTDRGIRIKTRRGRGGRIQGLAFRNLTMENNLCPLAINMYYRCGAEEADDSFSLEAMPVTDATPSVRDIRITGIRADGCRASAGFIVGLPESPVENISLKNCAFSTDEASGVSPDESDMFLALPRVTGKGIRLLHAKGAEFDNVTVTGPEETCIYR